MRVITLLSPEKAKEAAAEFASAGYGFLKIKLSGDPDGDLARVKAVQSEAPDGTKLMVDANGKYTTKDAIEIIKALEQTGVDRVEQPVAARNLDGLRRVRKAVTAAVEADESAFSLPAITFLATRRIVDSVNLRITALGGLEQVLAAPVCEASGIEYCLGGEWAPMIATGHLVHVAAALPNSFYAHALAEYVPMRNDPFSGLTIVNGQMIVPDLVRQRTEFSGAVLISLFVPPVASAELRRNGLFHNSGFAVSPVVGLLLAQRVSNQWARDGKR